MSPLELTTGEHLGTAHIHGGRGTGDVTLLGRRRESPLVLHLGTQGHVLWPVSLLTRLIAIVGVPATVVLSLLPTVGALEEEGRERERETYRLAAVNDYTMATVQYHVVIYM